MKHLLLTALLFLPAACNSETEVASAVSAAPADQVIKRSVQSVECGCTIEGIMKCGNYLSLEGAYLPIAKEGAGADLGPMEWCGQPGSTAEVEGNVEDGKFVASYIKTVKP
ncbi:MAG: hypothetical protein P1V81_06775 [Planctomycetota bacterium]|nr:hypothetical protein [Planctomycetota bacterium]